MRTLFRALLVVIAICATALATGGLVASRFGPANANPPSVILENVLAVSSGSTVSQHTCALTTSGGVKCWGLNSAGQLGNVTSGNHVTTPVDVCESDPGLYCTPLTSVTAISTGGAHSCALKADTTVVCWGLNHKGQLGNGESGFAKNSNFSVYVCATGASAPCSPENEPPNALTGVTQISAGGYDHTCARMADDTVKCWGGNQEGQLGDGTIAVNGRNTPADVCASGSWDGSSCSGGPLTGVAAVTIGGRYSCAQIGDRAMCWGYNGVGQLGDGSTTNRLNPVDVCAASAMDPPCDQPGEMLEGVMSIAAGGQEGDRFNVAHAQGHTCALVDDGSASGHGVSCWGGNGYGQLGHASSETCVAGGTHLCSTMPLRVCNTGEQPDCVQNLLGGALTLALGWAHTCVTSTDNAAKCWGSSAFGQLGDGTSGEPICPESWCRRTPVDVCAPGAPGPYPCTAPNLLSGVDQIAAGHKHTCARTTEGTVVTVVCWGLNEFGELGDGTRTPRFIPVAVTLDTDRDGCTDGAERNMKSGSQTTGGLRDPTNHWDFFDTPDAANVRDRVVTNVTGSNNDDIDYIVARFGTNDSGGSAPINRNSDPLSAPPSSGYHPAFDRSAPAAGMDPWDSRAPDGTIGTADIGLAAKHVDHDCRDPDPP